ncbi:hypothetical protein TSUD_273110 [Trifolium subterraneum]|uniref:Uncharacterized protein n=1 Tax=Trifolium subterraneum TaxID=3900 RepID=A0A2Z6LSP1_TRISU|nr:hypothetical protein TSUD_273110 [Trifolium subterraneum]
MEKKEATLNRSESNENAAATTLDSPVIPPTNSASQDSTGNGSSADDDGTLSFD